MYGELHALNDLSEHSDDDDIVNNPDDLIHSDVEEIPNENNYGVGDEAVNAGEGDETEKKDDEEARKVEPKRKRFLNPQPKLNDQRLKGPRGIGVIEKMFEDVKLKGKGYEKEDLDVVMGRLEHWAHRLFPKFQFDDCLQRVEKLGTKRIVLNYVKRIRLGMEDQIENEIIEPLSPEQTIDPFDDLVRQQQEPSQFVKKPVTLTAEQRERMLRNRMIAEERRMARLQAQKEKNAETNKNTEEETLSQISNIIEEEEISVPLQNISGVELSENCGEVCQEDASEKNNVGCSLSTSMKDLTDSGDTEIVKHANGDANFSNIIDTPVEEEEPPVDASHVNGEVSVTTIISDRGNESWKFL